LRTFLWATRYTIQSLNSKPQRAVALSGSLTFIFSTIVLHYCWL